MKYRLLIVIALILNGSLLRAQDKTVKSLPAVNLILIPPSLVTDQINLDIRAGIKNERNSGRKFNIKIFLDKENKTDLLFHTTVTIGAYRSATLKFNWPTRNKAGKHKIMLVCDDGSQTFRKENDLTIIASAIRSTKKIDGAFMGFYHWSETEGRFWNSDIKMMTDDQWRELVNAQHEVGMDIVIMQELFRNQMYDGKHSIEKDGYMGRAYYPSKLFPGRMPITAKDPVEDVLAQADKNGMHVFVAVGLYAWFDFSAGSLAWHKKVARELWEKYGHHPSFYGWYVSEEKDGGLGDSREREEIVNFFNAFSDYIHQLSPGKPVMLATNSMNIRGAEDTYKKLLPHLDILCTFGFHRMPKGDYTGEEAAIALQNLCNISSTHLWLDMEIFDFTPDNALVPRSITGLLHDMQRFPNFEKIVCYQFPGMMNSPAATIKPGGENTVKLFLDYKKYLDSAGFKK